MTTCPVGCPQNRRNHFGRHRPPRKDFQRLKVASRNVDQKHPEASTCTYAPRIVLLADRRW